MRISIWGVVVGGVADIVITNILAVLVILVWAFNTPGALHGGAAQAVPALQAAVAQNPVLHWTTFGVGLFGSVAGGFIAALIAKRAEVLNGALSAWLCIALAIFSLKTSTSELITPLKVAQDAGMSLLAAGFGGYVMGWLRRG